MREAERPAEKEIVTPDHRQLLGDGPAVKGGASEPPVSLRRGGQSQGRPQPRG